MGRTCAAALCAEDISHRHVSAKYCSVRCRKKTNIDSWRLANADHVAEYKKRYVEENREAILERDRAWYHANKEQSQAWSRAWRQRNLEADRARQRASYQKNRDARRAYASKWAAENPLSRRQNQHKRRMRLHGNDDFVRFPDSEWLKLLNRHGGRCAYCNSSGGGFPIEQDHVVPISRGGRHAIANILPACKSCNSSKNDMFLAEWRHSGVAADLISKLPA